MDNAKIYQAPEGIDMIHNGVTYGKQTELEYDSKTTGGKRKCYVYTPPHYDSNDSADSAAIYPVLYLLHCGGEAHDGWLHNGAANQIISNSIARGEAKPMLVVMPSLDASHIDSPPQNFDEQVNGWDNFINDLRDDLMPFIKERYPVSAQREQCAIAGSSIGGREALFIGIKMPEIFGCLGGFSPSPGCCLICTAWTKSRTHSVRVSSRRRK
jgi:enterochelin esterase-like enzyme